MGLSVRCGVTSSLQGKEREKEAVFDPPVDTSKIKLVHEKILSSRKPTSIGKLNEDGSKNLDIWKE